MWTVRTKDFHIGQQGFRYSRLVIAAGLTLIPYFPAFLPDQKTLEGPIRHYEYFGKVSKPLHNTPSCKNIGLLRAGKSATDMAYESVKKDKRVSWID